MAAIFCAQELGLPITVVVPETTPNFIVDKMRSEGAKVEVLGKVHNGYECSYTLSLHIDFKLSKNDAHFQLLLRLTFQDN